MGHLILWEETGNMKRHISKALLHQPMTHGACHLLVIVDSRDEQMGNLQPDASLPDGLQRVKNGL